MCFFFPPKEIALIQALNQMTRAFIPTKYCTNEGKYNNTKKKKSCSAQHAVRTLVVVDRLTSKIVSVECVYLDKTNKQQQKNRTCNPSGSNLGTEDFIMKNSGCTLEK